MRLSTTMENSRWPPSGVRGTKYGQAETVTRMDGRMDAICKGGIDGLAWTQRCQSAKVQCFPRFPPRNTPFRPSIAKSSQAAGRPEACSFPVTVRVGNERPSRVWWTGEDSPAVDPSWDVFLDLFFPKSCMFPRNQSSDKSVRPTASPCLLRCQRGCAKSKQNTPIRMGFGLVPSLRLDSAHAPAILSVSCVRAACGVRPMGE
jgi:hypothetical protein